MFSRFSLQALSALDFAGSTARKSLIPEIRQGEGWSNFQINNDSSAASFLRADSSELILLRVISGIGFAVVFAFDFLGTEYWVLSTRK